MSTPTSPIAAQLASSGAQAAVTDDRRRLECGGSASINIATDPVYAALGEAWIKTQTARIEQLHLQHGSHRKLDLDSLLSSIARRSGSPSQKAVRSEQLWRDTISVIRQFEDLSAFAQLKTAATAASPDL